MRLDHLLSREHESAERVELWLPALENAPRAEVRTREGSPEASFRPSIRLPGSPGGTLRAA